MNENIKQKLQQLGFDTIYKRSLIFGIKWEEVLEGIEKGYIKNLITTEEKSIRAKYKTQNEELGLIISLEQENGCENRVIWECDCNTSYPILCKHLCLLFLDFFSEIDNESKLNSQLVIDNTFKSSIDYWITKFRTDLLSIRAADKNKAGSLVGVIPEKEAWDNFLTTVKYHWNNIKTNMTQFPELIAILYIGTAFFFYEENLFWPEMSKHLDVEINLYLQRKMNECFGEFCNRYNLRLLKTNMGCHYVSSACYQVGIPLSLWGDFLKITYKLRQNNQFNFQILSSEPNKWNELINKYIPGSSRLKNFLLNNIELSLEYIKQLFDAKTFFELHPEKTIDTMPKDILKFREEYLAIPETIHFLKEHKTESLLRDRPSLALREDNKIVLRLPPIISETRHVWFLSNNIKIDALPTPAEVPISSDLLEKDLVVILFEDDKVKRKYTIPSLTPFGVFSPRTNMYYPAKGKMKLPTGRIIILHKKVIPEDNIENKNTTIIASNSEWILENNDRIYATEVEPVDDNAGITISVDNDRFELNYNNERREKELCSIYFLPGIGKNFFCWCYTEERYLLLEQIPFFYIDIKIPNTSRKDLEKFLNERFVIQLDDVPLKGNLIALDDYAGPPRTSLQSRFKWEPLRYDNMIEYETHKTLRIKLEHTTSPELNFDIKKEIIFIKRNKKIQKLFEKEKELWRFLIFSLINNYHHFVIYQYPAEEILCTSCEIKKLLKWTVGNYKNENAYGLTNWLPFLRESSIIRKEGYVYYLHNNLVYLRVKENTIEIYYCGDLNVIWYFFQKMIKNNEEEKMPKKLVFLKQLKTRKKIKNDNKIFAPISLFLEVPRRINIEIYDFFKQHQSTVIEMNE
ncbi:MAG: hypothetical protein QW728_08155 [Thermoplasmata archaeon]